MPAPTTAAEFFDLIRKSGVVEDARLSAWEQQTRSAAAAHDPTSLSGLLVRDGLLTHFQSENLLQGKWKRFNIGKYRVLERLGSGGMGQVFLCEHKLMRRRVAVKVLPSAKAGDPAALERFHREARAVAALDHAYLVRAFDIDQDGTLHFLVMEYVDGSNLQDIIKRTGPMDPLRACHYIRQAAVGLDYAFQVAGIVHRDIKPGNVLVDRSGTVKILDMGLARFFHDEQDILTKKYDETILGTADYLSPEQAIDSHSVDIRADIYGLGSTFYYVLTGMPPFPDGTIAQKLIWHQTKMPRPVREYRADVPAAVEAIVERMMRKDPSERFQTPADLAAALAPMTQNPIPPPADEEMPHLSPAAMVGGFGGNGPSSRMPRPGLPQPASGFGPQALPSPGSSADRAPNMSVFSDGSPKAPPARTSGNVPEAPAEISNPFVANSAPIAGAVNPFAGRLPTRGAPAVIDPSGVRAVYATESARWGRAVPAAEREGPRQSLWAVLFALSSIVVVGGVAAYYWSHGWLALPFN